MSPTHMRWIATSLLLLVTFTYIVTQSSSCGSNRFDIDRNHQQHAAMTGHVIETHRVPNIVECFRRCQQKCLCLSFNYAGDLWSNGSCELNSKDGMEHAQDVRRKEGSIFYNLNREVGLRCSFSLSCCDYDNPCQHGGTCSPTCSTSGLRFKCYCGYGKKGDLCETIDTS